MRPRIPDAAAPGPTGRPAIRSPARVFPDRTSGRSAKYQPRVRFEMGFLVIHGVEYNTPN